MEASDTITSCLTSDSFKIRGSFDCTSQHVVYVVTCLKCWVQGVGECSSPLSRLSTYIRAVEDHPPDQSCAIHKHFAEADHRPEDLSFCIVAGLPPRLLAKPALIPALRKRLEFIWIHRLGAVLNKRRFLWHSFSGDYAARNEATRDE